MREVRTDCFKCRFKRNILGDSHILCINPDKEMRGNLHGINHGWFYYPLNFDPIWMEKECSNFEAKA